MGGKSTIDPGAADLLETGEALRVVQGLAAEVENAISLTADESEREELGPEPTHVPGSPVGREEGGRIQLSDEIAEQPLG